MSNNLQTLEPAAKVMAATAMSEAFSFCMERKYLQNIDNSEQSAFSMAVSPVALNGVASWIEVKQVGKPIDNSAESCFTAIQKILYSCFLPKESQLLFLVKGDGITNRLYLGLRAPGKAAPAKSTVKNLNEFIKGIWPGLQTEVVTDSEEGIVKFKSDISTDKLEFVYALTGIPSMDSQYKTLYPATIDKLIAGLNKSKNYAYLVVADPIPTEETEAMLYQCREMNGQAESLKSMNVTEGVTEGTSTTVSTSHTEGTSTSHSVSISKKDFSKLGKAAMGITGLGLAASVFPAAGAVLEGVAETTGAIASAAASLMGYGMVANVITGLMPQKATSDTESTSSSNTTSQSYGTSESKSQSISRNVVNKHVEAVSESLYFHSQRIANGKATGLWRVGTYLMAEKESELKGAALQLRSILSGQETIFEPIRIHNITQILDVTRSGKSMKELTLGQMNAPSISILGHSGKPFNHPLGAQYSELKSVLTTKELSYLINFPLHSVPGISVVDSSPEFSLNQQKEIEGGKYATFGKLLFGGGETGIEYKLPLDNLSRHTLLCGINGSGKTNTVQSILNGIGNLPFLVIEPAKTEYVDWAIEYNKSHKDNQIDIYIPGCKKYKSGYEPRPLKLNPFEVVWLEDGQDPNVLTHIDRLKSTFAAAFPMYDVLPILMEDLIYSLYQNKSTDWLRTTPQFGKTLPPTLNAMKLNVEPVIKSMRYEERIEKNMQACLNTRINSLMRGWKGEMLNTLKSTPWNDLFEKPVIINLSYVGDDSDKAFFMALILQFLYEYKAAIAEVGRVNFNDNTCKHLTIIEEAHRVMAKCDNPEMPQYKSAMMFSNMLSEIRAYGEGLLLVDQVPTRLIPDAIKNTNLKICHRLVSEDDCKAIGESMSLSDEQRKVISKLMTGQCIVSSSLSTDTYWIKVNKVK